VSAQASARPPRRGRPPKFGRPARLVAVTLPTDVVAWLERRNPDLGRAIVGLHDAAARGEPREGPADPPVSELADIGEGRALIVVDPALVRGLAGVAAIRFGEGRAFLALEPAWTMADLELAVADCLEAGVGDDRRRRDLAAFRQQLRAWRTDRSITMASRAIIVAARRARRKPRKPMRA